MSAIQTVLASLIDYAGLYPPASHDMRSAVENYLRYSASGRAFALGRFIVDLNRVDAVRSVAGDATRRMKLSAIVPPDGGWATLSRLADEGVPIEAIEIRAASIEDLARMDNRVPLRFETYIEVPFASAERELTEAIAAMGARVKVRMGGLVASAIPSAESVVRVLAGLAQHRIPFKATAGLHHPVRSHYPFTYARDSPTGTMHGFINLCCAAALLYFAGDAREAALVLEEQDAGAWHVSSEAISWRAHRWTSDQWREVREKFLVSFGSCSFEEPIRELEGLQWL